MTTQEIITSGILELYVCGALSTDEHNEICEKLIDSPELRLEVENIEKSFMELSHNTAPNISAKVWPNILAAITPVKILDSKTNWLAITGWAAAILCIGGIFWMLNKNGRLQDEIKFTNEQNNQLEEEVDNAASIIVANENVLDILSSKDYNSILLSGNQAVAPQAFTKVLYNKKDAAAYIDIKGLSKAPEGKVYQVWSLILEPLRPTSIGTLDITKIIGDRLYKFEAIPETSQAFGITLEPTGGSKTPTLSQLYTLGSVSP